MDLAPIVALGSLLVAIVSLGVTVVLAVLNRRAQVEDREAYSREAHESRLWEQKLPAVVEYLIWLEDNIEDPPPDYPAPDTPLYVRVTTFGPRGVDDQIAATRHAFNVWQQLRRQGFTTDEVARAQQAAGEAFRDELHGLRALLQVDLVDHPAAARDFRWRHLQTLRDARSERRKGGAPV